MAEVKSSEGRAIVWVYREGMLATASNRSADVSDGHLGLSNRAWRLLGLSNSDDKSVELVIPRQRQIKILTSKVDDIPVGLSVHVDRSLARELGSRRDGSRWALASCAGQAIPLRLVVRRDLKATALRMSMLVRILSGVNAGDDLSLAAFPPKNKADRIDSLQDRLPAVRRRISNPHMLTFLGAMVFIFRLIDAAIEWCFRLIFRAPEVVVRTIQAQTGDDDSRLIRLHPSVFAALGIESGGQVIIGWGGQRAVAIALDDYKLPSDGPMPVLSKAQMVELSGTWSEAPFPDHLVGRLSSQIRRDLDAPALTVVIVRRRLRTLVLTHINQLVIPVGGLLVAAAALPELRGWPLVIGAIAVTILSLGNLRLPHPRKGIWP